MLKLVQQNMFTPIPHPREPGKICTAEGWVHAGGGGEAQERRERFGLVLWSEHLHAARLREARHCWTGDGRLGGGWKDWRPGKPLERPSRFVRVVPPKLASAQPCFCTRAMTT